MKVRRVFLRVVLCISIPASLTACHSRVATLPQQQAPSYSVSQSLDAAIEAQAAAVNVTEMHEVNPQTLRATPAIMVGHSNRVLPVIPQGMFGALKAQAAHNLAAPATFNATPALGSGPVVEAKESGLSETINSSSLADLALGRSSQHLLEVVNSEVGVFNASGGLESGWPKPLHTFFGVSHDGSCNNFQYPELTQSRAFYDQNDGRFWFTTLERDGPPFNHCSSLANLLIAVSKTSNPNLGFNTYRLPLRINNTNFIPDFPGLGYDRSAVYFSSNMFNQSEQQFQYAEIFAGPKSKMEAGTHPVTLNAFFNLHNGTALLDSVQPMVNPTTATGTPGLFINSQNGNACATSCNWIYIMAMANPLGSNPSLSGRTVMTPKFSIPPDASQPGCTRCIYTLDNRIGATPFMYSGTLLFNLNTAFRMTSGTTSAILWGQVDPTLSSGRLTGAALRQSGYVTFNGGFSYDGAIANDAKGNFYLQFNASGNTYNPGIYFTGRQSGDPLGTMRIPQVCVPGPSPYRISTSWGLYSAAALDPAGINPSFGSMLPKSSNLWTTVSCSYKF